ncbi:tetratricopeptide repeat protein [Gimesia panareensis]|uniref:tetratricopeptide repeat protein n=1 Tax=Gimesia panareensis TaxID=2527978 RepID=UPI00118B7566|nr:tetratricopeptide repeat protein [Gimesia panareensis]QDU47803.1 Tetratricopeptide repeat protein [Gimesia panareensis]
MLFRSLMILFVVEALFCGYFLFQRAARPEPVLPETRLMDPLFVEDIQPLVAQVKKNNAPYDWMQLGEALLGQGYYSHAELCFGQVAELVPESRLAESRIAYCLERTGRTEQSTDKYLELLATTDQSREGDRERMQIRYEIGRNYLREEQTEAAEAIFRENLGFLPARYQLAKLLIRSDRVNEALPLIEESIQRVPRSLKFRELELQAHRKTDNTESFHQCALELERAQHSVPLHPGSNFIEPFRLQYGIDRRVEEFNKRLAGGSLDELAGELEQLLALLGERPTTHHPIFLMRLVEVDRQRKRPERMRETIQQLNNMRINNAEILLYRAQALGMLGDWNQARVLAQRAALMSKDPELHQSVSEILEQAGQGAEGKTERALALRLKAMQAYRANQLNDAEELIEKSIELNPEDAHAWYDRGMIRLALERAEAARADFASCLQRNPRHGRARAQLERNGVK